MSIEVDDICDLWGLYFALLIPIRTKPGGLAILTGPSALQQLFYHWKSLRVTQTYAPVTLFSPDAPALDKVFNQSIHELL